MVSVSILIVGYRSEDFISKCLAAIPAAAALTPHETLLIDNGAGETDAAVRARHPDVTIVPSEGNIGFGAGNNRLAAAASAPLLLLLNPDTVAKPGSIDALVAFAESRPDAAAWGGRMVSADGVADSGNALILPRPADYLRAVVRGLGAFSSADRSDRHGQVDVLSGGYMMIRADVFRALGGFDESFFLYSEEIDLFRRFRAAGHRALFTVTSEVVHDSGSGDPLSPHRIAYRVIGQMHDARKHFSRGGAIVSGLSIWAMAAQRWFGGAIGATLTGRPRFRALSQAWGPVARHPARWWNGYESHCVQTSGMEDDAP